MGRPAKYTREILEPIVKESSSLADVLKKLGLQQAGGTQRNIKERIEKYQLDTSHFTGQTWNKGQTKESSDSVRLHAEKISYKHEEVLVEQSPRNIGRGVLKRLMLEAGIPYRCQNGHEAVWMDMPLTLHIDHINANFTDNRLENLRFLCPNCHQQTPTWGKGVKGLKKK